MKKLTLCFLLFSCIAGAQPKMVWPGHKKAVIVLTYDDAIDSQLNIAIPQLDALKFKGTFFLTGLNADAIPLWRAAGLKGHELANHTLYHPCLLTTVAGNSENDSGHYTVFRMLREIDTQNNFLAALDGRSMHTYAYPCTETKVGGVNYVDSLRKAGTVKYARIGGDADAIVTDFEKLDPLQVPAFGLEEHTPAEKLIAFVKRVEQSGGMGVFMFHGVGGNYITTSAEAHQQLLNLLAANKKYIWVATFQEAMDYIAQANKPK